jgi:hypothetical protein
MYLTYILDQIHQLFNVFKKIFSYSTIERVEKNAYYLKVQLEEDFHNVLETPNED